MSVLQPVAIVDVLSVILGALCVASSEVPIFVRMFPAKTHRRNERKNSLDVFLAPLRLCGKCLVAAGRDASTNKPRPSISLLDP